MINGVAMNGKWIVILFALQKQILDQLHNNNMGIDKNWFLVGESV